MSASGVTSGLTVIERIMFSLHCHLLLGFLRCWFASVPESSLTLLQQTIKISFFLDLQLFVLHRSALIAAAGCLALQICCKR